MSKPLRTLLLAALLTMPSYLRAATDDVSFSGFGTLGYAVSDSEHRYLRFIDRDGTAKADSLLGAQMTTRLSPFWEASVQAVLTPANNSDSGWQTRTSWAVLSYRPDNDWLLRLGKLRVPFFLASENRDLGATYDLLRLPGEVYAMAPTSDFTGLSLSRNWDLPVGELGMELYRGRAEVYERLYMNGKAEFMRMKTESTGLIGTLRRQDDVYRLGAHQTRARPLDGGHQAPPPTDSSGASTGSEAGAGGGGGYDDDRTLIAPLYTVGADVGLGSGFRLLGELAYRKVQQGGPVNSTLGYYLAVLRPVERWTPYVAYAETRTRDRQGSSSNQAEALHTIDQATWSVGTSYALSPTQKVKAEWMHVRLGDTTALLDVPSGERSEKQVQVLSFSYNFVF